MRGPQWTAVDRMLQLMSSWLSVVTCVSAWVATSAQRHFSRCGVPDVYGVSDRECEELPHTLPDHLLRSVMVRTYCGRALYVGVMPCSEVTAGMCSISQRPSCFLQCKPHHCFVYH